MKKFTESIEICNMILELYPNNADVLVDKSCNYALLYDYPNCYNCQCICYNFSVHISLCFYLLSHNLIYL